MKKKLSLLLVDVLNKKGLALGLVLSLLGTFLGLFIPQMIGRFLDETYIRQLLAKPSQLGVILLFFITVYLAQTLSIYLLARVGGQALQALQERFYKHFIHLPIEKAEQFQSGDLASRLTNDMAVVLKIVTRSLPQLLTNALVLLGSIYFLLSISPMMTGLSALLFPILAGLIIPINSKLEKRYLAYQSSLGDLSAYVSHKCRHLRLIKSYIGEQVEEQQSRQLLSCLVSTYHGIVTLSALQSILVNSLFMGFLMMMLLIAGNEVVQGHMTVATLTTFILYLVQLISPISEVAEIVTDVSEFKGVAQRLEEILAISMEDSGASQDDLGGQLVFTDLSFTYPDQLTPVFEHLNLTLGAGQHLAIIGESGSGKSTIFSLLMKFYTHYHGHILLGGCDLRTLSSQQIRQKIAYVSQENHLFQGTIRENLLYGKNEAVSEERLLSVLRTLDLERVIAQLDKGLDSQISDLGTGLSQGQKQRLCIARALMTEADIYLFDEITASLDKENETIINQAIEVLTKGKTRLTIAHRLNTVQQADAYLILHKDEISLSPTLPIDYLKKAG